MTSAWETAALLPVRPPDELAHGDVVVTGQGTYWECGSADWHLMLGWFAGPATLRRWPDDREQSWTVIEEDAAGNRQVSQRLVTSAERADEDNEINQLLAERGIPARPGGFRWFQLVPPDKTGSDVVAAYMRVQRELHRCHDMELETAYARAAVEELYGLPVTPPPPIPASLRQPAPENPRHTARIQAEQVRQASLLPGAPGAVPILRCRDLRRSLAFYATLGFRGEELSGYAVLRHPTAELHLSETSNASPGGCLIRVPDAAALWHSLDGQPTLGPIEDDNPGMVTFTLLDPDHNQLLFVST
ncbi:hypothetical protein FB565_006838 [Actinoplanes lutulentus]|uniref:DUF5956 family protein n=1 Tax=Actinoplanes lutulentus TaxID=1287878 RepID=UPI0011B9488E|nr:DUF5956 family protein [Actinoplanes lutulentus]MBB2947070.1 hypothetical protein [Actinoplanes lutulentus]